VPLKLHPPRPGKSPNWTVRGTHLGVYLDKSTGTPNEALAKKLKKAWEKDIESGAVTNTRGPTFLEAALSYVENGGDPRFVGSCDETTGKWSGLIGHFGDTLASSIRQADIDAAAVKLYPKASAATRNRQVYAVVSVILKRAGVEFIIRRPKGSAGKKQTSWLTKEQAFALMREANAMDAEFGLLITTLLYTGMRLNEALMLRVDLLELDDALATIPKTKNSEPRGVYLPPNLADAIRKHPRGLDRPKQRLFRFTKSGRLYAWLDEALTKAGIELPSRSAFHVLRHTWATWMRRYGGLDTRGLVGTGAWKDAKSAARYEHVVASEEARRADMLPVDKSKGRGIVVDNKPKALRRKR
jgi:integrase